MKELARRISLTMVNSSAMGATVALMLLVGLTAFAQAQRLRALTADDLFKLEEIGQVAISPDGKWLAYVIKRPRESSLIQMRPFLEGNDRGDMWLVSTGGGEPENLTNGAVDNSGWWSPVWAPDSQRLALVSTRGDNVRLWVWEKSSKSLKRVTERAVDISIGQQAPVIWLNNRQLVCPVLAEGQKPNPMTVEMRASETAMREWAKAWRGDEVTASVLESGVPPSLDQRPQGQLLLIDVTKGSRILVAGYGFRDLRRSSDQRHVAALRQIDFVQPDSNKPLAQNGSTPVYQAIAFDANGNSIFNNIEDVKNVLAGSLQWSPGGRSLAFIGSLSAAKPQAIVCSLASHRCEALQTYEEPTALSWSDGNVLLMLSMATSNSRQDWFAFHGGEKSTNLTAKMKLVPRELISESQGKSFVGLADGEVWRIHMDRSEPQNLTADFAPRIASVVGRTPTDRNAVMRLLLAVRAGMQTDWHELDLSSGHITSLNKPHADGTLVGFSPQHQTGAFVATDHTGSYLWLTNAPYNQPRLVVEANTYLRKIAEAEFKRIDYRSVDGQDLIAWVMLPIGHENGKRYPLVTVVYGGIVFGDNPPPMARSINNGSSLNYQLLAAHGYAVLFPSMPARSEPYAELTKGVLPAVDKAIEVGIADPKRLGLMGQSYGGYATYGLITQTNRFQAAISLAGLSDLVSVYGSFDPRFRYDAFAQERQIMVSMAETGQLRMGNPPWKDSERYVRNSPIFHISHAETPLMIIQGDEDFVGMQQGEEVFTALYRQHKRAAFVRYWGEGHVLEGQANVRDLWRRIYEWFDKFFEKENATRQ